MRTTLLTLATAAISFTALAVDTSTTINADSISVTATPTSLFKNIVKDTSLSVATGVERNNINDAEASGYLDMNVNQKFSDDFSATLSIRTEMTRLDDNDAASYHMIDPRIFINAFNRTYGKVTIAPQFRIQPHTNGDTHKGANYGNLATWRIGATASMPTSSANSIAISAFVYDNIADNSAGDQVSDEGHFYLVLNETYAFNDNHSVNFTYEHFTDVDQDDKVYRSTTASNDVTLRYVNNSISKDATIAPYAAQNTHNVKAERLKLGVDFAYNF